MFKALKKQIHHYLCVYQFQIKKHNCMTINVSIWELVWVGANNKQQRTQTVPHHQKKLKATHMVMSIVSFKTNAGQ